MAKSDLLSKLKAASVVKQVDILSDSKFFNERPFIQTPIPILNLALSGRLDGGLSSGVTILAGPSKVFKSSSGISMVAGFLNHDPEAICIFYDSEFGTTQAYFSNMGVDISRVLHVPISNIEELKFDCVKKLEEISEKDKVMIFIDSIGNLASKKEVEDAVNEKSVADMSRAKSLKSFFRIITPDLTKKNIPAVMISHTYQSMDFIPKQVLGGGTGAGYAANTVLFISRSQNKDGKELKGYNFNITVEKSRFLREQTKIPLTVSFEAGINKYSGLFELATELGFIVKPAQGWYHIVNPDTGVIDTEQKLRASAIESNPVFWDKMLKSKFFVDAVQTRFALSSGIATFSEPSEDEEYEEELPEIA